MSAAVSIDSSRTTRAPRRGLVTWLTLAAVAITFAASGFVFSEPAPVDALTIGLIVLLPTATDFDLAGQFLRRYETGLRAGDALHLAIASNNRATAVHSR